MDLSVLFVHYHTPGLLEDAFDALRRDLESAALTAEWIVVDNGSDEAGRRRLDELTARVLRPVENLGYAGGLALAAAEARGPVLLVMNPDVMVARGCVSRLLAALEAGAEAAGPKLYLDEERRMLLPLTEERTFLAELLGELATGSEWWARRARRRFRFHSRTHWAAREPFSTVSLNGSILAIRASTWTSTGGFDPSFQLYFEETDWLLRLARAGGRSVYVPDAKAVHLYNQSAAQKGSAAGWFAGSRERFRRRHYGRIATRLLALASGRSGRNGAGSPQLLETSPGPPRIDLPASWRPGDLWVELSPNATGFPAAAERLSSKAESWQLPQAIWERLAPGAYVLQVVRGEDEELARWRFTRPAAPVIAPLEPSGSELGPGGT